MRLSNAAASAAAGNGTNKGLSDWIGSGAILKHYTGSVGSAPEAGSLPSGTLLSSSGNVVTGTFGTATNGAIATTTVASDTAAASGTAGCWVLFKSDGATVVADGATGTSGSGADNIMSTTTIVSGGTISVTSITITEPPH